MRADLSKVRQGLFDLVSNDLLDIEKMQAGSTRLTCEELNAVTFVAAALEQVAALAADGETTIVTDIDPDLPSFEADAGKLTRTRVNLIANAISSQGPEAFRSARRATATASDSPYAIGAKGFLRRHSRGFSTSSRSLMRKAGGAQASAWRSASLRSRLTAGRLASKVRSASEVRSRLRSRSSRVERKF